MTEPGRYTTEMYAAIGRYVVVWSRVEYVLKSLLAEGTRADVSVAYTLLEGMPVGKIIERCGYLVDASDADDKQVVLDWLRAARAVNVERNDLIHRMWARAGWVQEADTVAQVALSAKKGRFDVTEVKVSLSDVRESIARAEAVLEGVQNWSQFLYDTIP